MIFIQIIRSLSGTFAGIMAAAFLVASAAVCQAEPAKPVEEQFVVTSRIYPAIGREDELETRLIRETQLAKKLGSEFTFRLHRSVNEPVLFVFYQIYPSKAVFEERHAELMQTVHKELGPLPEGILARLSEVEYFHILVD